jgi:hypothetical protein
VLKKGLEKLKKWFFPDFQPMRVSEEPVCIYIFRQNPVFTSLHSRFPESIATIPPFGPIEGHKWLFQRRYDMNGIFQMQGGKNWILPKKINTNRFFWDSHSLEIWSNHFCPSMGPNGGSVAMDSDFQPMRVSEEPVCISLFRQNPVFSSLHFRSPVLATGSKLALFDISFFYFPNQIFSVYSTVCSLGPIKKF